MWRLIIFTIMSDFRNLNMNLENIIKSKIKTTFYLTIKLRGVTNNWQHPCFLIGLSVFFYKSSIFYENTIFDYSETCVHRAWTDYFWVSFQNLWFDVLSTSLQIFSYFSLILYHNFQFFIFLWYIYLEVQRAWFNKWAAFISIVNRKNQGYIFILFPIL